MASVESVVHQTVDVTTTAALLFGEDAAGGFLLLQNISDTDMYFSYTGDAEVGAGILLKAGGNLLLDSVIIDSPLSVVHGGTGSKKLLVTMG
jgi:hypothetical protein